MPDRLLSNHEQEAKGYSPPVRSILRKFAGYPQAEPSGGTRKSKRPISEMRLERWEAVMAEAKAKLEQAED